MSEETSPERVRTHSSRHSTRHHRHNRSHKALLLYLGLAFLLLTVIGLSIRLGMYARDNARLIAMEQTQATQLAQREQEMGVLRGELAALVENRLPRLSPIVLDEVIPVNEHYVRNVMFMMTRKQREQRYEYTLVMDNSSARHIYPEVKIMLFDRAGIQVGVSTVGYDNQGRPNQDVLERGEIRTHSSFVQIFDESPPEYYLIQVNAS